MFSPHHGIMHWNDTIITGLLHRDLPSSPWISIGMVVSGNAGIEPGWVLSYRVQNVENIRRTSSMLSKVFPPRKKSHHTLGLPWWPLANLTGEGLAKICWQLSLVFVFVLVCQLQWSGLEESSFACVCKSKGFYSGSDHACRGKLKQPALQCHGHKHLSQDNLFHWYLIGMVPLEQCGYTFLMSTTEKCL